MVARSDASKKGPQLREKSRGQVQQRLQKIGSLSKSRETLLCEACQLKFDNTDWHHHNGDFLRACFIPTFSSLAWTTPYLSCDTRVYFRSMQIYSIGKCSDRPHDCLIEASLQE
jgi:hypothetical protein